MRRYRILHANHAIIHKQVLPSQLLKTNINPDSPPPPSQYPQSSASQGATYSADSSP